MALVDAPPRRRARRFCGRPPANLKTGPFSTGGTRRRAAAFVPVFRRLPVAPLCRLPLRNREGDREILAEQVPWVRSRSLDPTEHERLESPRRTTVEQASIYEHCVRALEHSLRWGEHGLPLMGCGDWNDGMNLVGAGGRGESVWLAWFLIVILEQFAKLAEVQADFARATRYRQEAAELRVRTEEQAWDGGWYRRAYFDDGTPLGSANNEECRIDSIAQSWAVLASADPIRTRQAMQAADRHLVVRRDRLILLFTPPFTDGALEPGYIKGYLPGVRENGGQFRYMHAATWVVLATALQGRGKRRSSCSPCSIQSTTPTRPNASSTIRWSLYVVAADVYGAPPHTGRGGWTWYTGSASWLYRVGLEAILGFRLRGDRLKIEPCVAPDWPGYELTYRHRSATYHVVVENAAGTGRGVRTVTLDTRTVSDGEITLVDDGKVHEVRVELG